MVSECQRCGGISVIQVPAQSDERGAVYNVHGWVKFVPCPSCADPQERINWLKKQTGLRTTETQRFADYWANIHGKQPLIAANNVLTNKGWLTVMGRNGTGKTWLLCAIVNEAVELGLLAVYLRMSDLLDELRRGYDPETKVDFSDRWRRLMQCDVLCIDEAEKWSVTSWATEKATMLLDDRYRDAGRLATTLAVNHLEELPQAIKSRAMDKRFRRVEMVGDARREPVR